MGSSTILLWRRRGRLLNVPMVVANFALFFCCTAHFALEFNHYYTTLVSDWYMKMWSRDTQRNILTWIIGSHWCARLCKREQEFRGCRSSDFFDGYVRGFCSSLPVLACLGQKILHHNIALPYRGGWLWWSSFHSNRWGIDWPPASTACTAEIIHLLEDLDPSAPVAPASLVPLGIAAYTLPLFTNVMVTSLIVGRIWWITRRLAGVDTTRSSGASVRRAMVILAESGALYLVTQLIFVIVFALKHPSQAIMGVVAVQIYVRIASLSVISQLKKNAIQGIAPTLIIIGVELGISSDQMTTNATLTSFQARRTFPESSRTFTTVASSELTYGNPQSPMRLSHLKKVDSDGDFKAPEF